MLKGRNGKWMKIMEEKKMFNVDKNRHGWNPIQIIFTINELMMSTIIVKGFKVTCCGLD